MSGRQDKKIYNTNLMENTNTNNITWNNENIERKNNSPSINEQGLKINLQINKQDIIQKISNNTMCHALSTAEYLALRVCNENKTINNIWNGYHNMFISNKSYKDLTPIFGSYDAFDAGKNKPYKDLICQLIVQIEIFKGDYINYIKKNKGKYQFPSNLSLEQILRIIILWSNELKNIELNKGKFHEYGISKYFDNLFNLIYGRPTIDYSMDIYNLEATNPNRGKFNPEGLLKGNMLCSHHLETEDLKNPENKDISLFGENKLKYQDNFD
jgi:hypothetical protein